VLALPPVSIVIPTRDRPELLRQTVQSVLDGDSLPAEIVVVDQSSGPRAALPAGESVEIRRLELSSRGLSRARNAGVAAATHDVIVMIDDDVRVQPDWLRRLVDALLAAPAGTVVTGTVAAPPTTTDGFVPSTTSRTEPETFFGRQPGDFLFGGNMAMRRAVFEQVGPFDERLGAGALFASAEDNDWGYRLLEAGCEIARVAVPDKRAGEALKEVVRRSILPIVVVLRPVRPAISFWVIPARLRRSAIVLFFSGTTIS